jgi:hypothetical protein
MLYKAIKLIFVRDTHKLNPQIAYKKSRNVINKCKGKVHPRTGHESRRESGGEALLYLTPAIDEVDGQLHAPAALSPGKTRYPLYRRLGRLQGRSGRVNCNK